MKKEMTYLDSVHRDGRIWNISVMIALFMYPILVGVLFGVLLGVLHHAIHFVVGQGGPVSTTDGDARMLLTAGAVSVRGAALACHREE